MDNVCPIAGECPVYSGTLKDKIITTKVYKSQYCENGEEGRKDCRRWQFINEFGRAPDDLLPHSTKSIEKIFILHNWEL